jgi:CheY-like chemotaxis protein
MPGTDGRKTLGIIKSLPKLKSIPVIIFTTSSDKRDVKQCYDSGANTYIQKPVNFEQMKKICSLLKDYWFNTAILPEDEPEDYMM